MAGLFFLISRIWYSGGWFGHYSLCHWSHAPNILLCQLWEVISSTQCTWHGLNLCVENSGITLANILANNLLKVILKTIIHYLLLKLGKMTQTQTRQALVKTLKMNGILYWALVHGMKDKMRSRPFAPKVENLGWFGHWIRVRVKILDFFNMWDLLQNGVYFTPKIQFLAQYLKNHSLI